MSQKKISEDGFMYVSIYMKQMMEIRIQNLLKFQQYELERIAQLNAKHQEKVRLRFKDKIGVINTEKGVEIDILNNDNKALKHKITGLLGELARLRGLYDDLKAQEKNLEQQNLQLQYQLDEELKNKRKIGVKSKEVTELKDKLGPFPNMSYNDYYFLD